MDDFLGPLCKDIPTTDDRKEAEVSDLRWFQKGVNWPEPAAAGGGAPVLHTGSWAHSLQHPIRDPRSAATVAPMAPIMQQLLRTSPQKLKLFHQNYRRTDPSPPGETGYPVIDTNGRMDGGKAGFHMDSAFLPWHYAATPRLNNYITILALSPVVSGGAAFMYAPGSLQAAMHAGASLAPHEANQVTAKGCRTLLPKLVGQGVPDSEVSICRKVAQEVTMDTGDMLVLDPMLSHSGSPFREGLLPSAPAARYVLFSLFADESAIGRTLTGLRSRNYTAPADKYTDEMKTAVPQEWRALLEWELPDDTDSPELISQPRL
eukprot:COSAG02_NODE_774_length_17325_cov_322.794381_9_plen_318_part_00